MYPVKITDMVPYLSAQKDKNENAIVSCSRMIGPHN